MKSALTTVLPRNASGVNVATTSTPCDEVSNALVKNRKLRRSRAASTPSASSTAASIGVRTKLAVIPIRSDTSTRK